MRTPIKKDEEIINEILHAAAARGRPPERGQWGSRYCPDGPACAIGLGLIYADVPPFAADRTFSPPRAFAAHYGTSDAYAYGVSDGFEAWSASARDSQLRQNGMQVSDEWRRGHRVGQIIADAVGIPRKRR